MSGVTRNINQQERDIVRQAELYFNGSVISGGTITPTGGVGFTISSGEGYAKNNLGRVIRVTWGVLTSSAAVDGDNYISIDYTGAIVQTTTFPSADNIAVGYIRTTGGNTTIIGLNSLQAPHVNGAYALTQWERRNIGTLIETGCGISLQPNPNQLKVTMNSGTLWALLNEISVASTSAFTKIYTDTANAALVDATNPDTIDNAKWNNRTLTGAAALVNMTAGYWKKDVFFVTTEGQLFYGYASTEYATHAEALAAPIPTLPDSITKTIARLASVVIQQGATDVDTLNDIRPILSRIFETGAAQAPSTVTAHADLTGLGADDHLQYHTDVRGDIRYYTKAQSDANYEPLNPNLFDTATDTSDNITEGSTNLFMDATESNLLNNVLGTVWYSGLQFTPISPTPDQTLDYSNGIYYIAGVENIVASSGNLDLSSYFTALSTGQKQWVAIVGTTGSVLSTVGGTPVSGSSQPEFPALAPNQVCLFYVFIKKSAGDIEADDLVDCRRAVPGTAGTDRFVRVSADDITSKTLSDALSNTGNVVASVLGAPETDQKLELNVNLSSYETTAQLNTRDTNNRNRANHTGTQLASTISDLTARINTDAPAETTQTVGNLVNSATSKATPVNADQLGLMDSASGNILRKLSWSNVKETLQTHFNTIYQAILVSGTNIKTVKGISVLGSGDIPISENATHTGDVTGATALTIANNVVTNAKLSQVATQTFKGRTTAATGNVEDLTVTQATAMLNTFTSALKGLAPASGGGTTNFLRADGTWAAPAGGGGSTVKAGKILAASFTGTPDRKATVTIVTPFANADYSISVIGVDQRAWTIDAGQTASSFTINSNSASALTGDVQWIATPHANS